MSHDEREAWIEAENPNDPEVSGSGAAGQEFPSLFAPGRIGRLTLSNRVLMAPMEKNYCTRDGVVTRRYIEYLRARAMGGVPLVRVEATYVDPVGKGRMYQLGAHSDATVHGLGQLAAAVHEAGSGVSIELCHSGRQTNSRVSGFQPVAPSQSVCGESGGYMARELTEDEIVAIVARFAAAAGRAKAAGLDAVEIHGASGYLVNAFLSPFTNHRSDRYGGSAQRRMQFPLEVVDAVRRRVGPEFPLLYRLCVDEFVEGGLTLEDTVPFAKELENAGVDLIDVSGGIYESIFRTIPPMEAPPAELAHCARAIKGAVRIPVSVAGKLGDLHEAERMLSDGYADFVTIGRGLHADPDLLTKARAGRLDEVRVCISCSTCSDFLGRHSPAYCAVNPATGREAELRLRKGARRKRILVVGAGPAGLEAARAAALRGHEVAVVERETRGGGQLRYGALCQGRAAFEEPAFFLMREAARLGVQMGFGVPADREVVAEAQPDVVILASGGVPERPPIPGLDADHVASAFELFATAWKQRIGEPSEDSIWAALDATADVVIIGGNWIGCQAADLILSRGAAVTLVETGPAFAEDVGRRSGRIVRERVARHPRSTLLSSTTVENIEGQIVTIWDQSENVRRSVFSTSVIYATQMVANRALEAALVDLSDEARFELILVGDCVQPRNLHDAMYEGAVVGANV